MMKPAFLGALLLACGASSPRAFTPGAPHVATPSRGWIQFEPQSTYFCARLPDGQFRTLAYGVGTGFVLQPGLELPAAQRDAMCGPRNLMVLGGRGELAYAGNNGHFKMSYEMLAVEPSARSIGWLEAPCVLDDAGKVTCVANEKSTAGALEKLVNAQGPVREFLRGVPCVLMRDARVLCGRVNGEPGLIPMWADVEQASVYALGWSEYGGCALLRSRKVSCLGESWLGQRGYLAKINPHDATEVPGLEGVDEVAASSTNACARRGGEIVCWGSAGRRACGDEAYEASRPIPACVVDRAATDAAQKSYEEAERTCHDPKRERGHDDPFCRSMWRSSPPGKVFVGGGIGCDPSGHDYYRWAPPTRVGGIDDAVAIGTNGGLSCAIHASGSLTCWGSEQKGTRSLDFPPRIPPPKIAPDITVATRGVSLSVGEDQVIVATSSGAHVSYALGKTIGPPVTLDHDVVDAVAGYHRACLLHEGGHVTCDKTADANPPEPGFPTEPTAVRLFFSGSQGCVLRRDGVLRCGPTLASQYESGRQAAILSATGPITDAASSCALGSDGAVRCMLRSGEPPRVVWQHAERFSIESSFGCAVSNGAVSCSGMNYAFQRGDEDQAGVPLPGEKMTTLAGLPPITRVAVSTTHACALDKDGDVHCWGRATDGETGAAAFGAASTQPDTNPIQRRLARPMRVPGVMHAIAIAAWTARTCAITETELVCWGRGMSGVQRVPMPK